MISVKISLHKKYHFCFAFGKEKVVHLTVEPYAYGQRYTQFHIDSDLIARDIDVCHQVFDGAAQVL